MVKAIEHSFNFDQYTLAAFLDIEGVLKNVNLNAISSIGVNSAISWVDKC